MNSVKIEKGAILALKRIIYLHGKMNELLNEDDKEPSWDGDILIYSNEDLKVENIIYKIPTQVKGKNDENLLKRSRITYPVEYKNLRNYFNNGGVCYFVIIISDDGERVAIFYNALTPIKLQSLLKGTEEKRPDQTKNISLNRLKNNDKNELYRILLQFGYDSKEQGRGELIRNAIQFKDIKQIDKFKVRPFTSTFNEAIKKIENMDICLYGCKMDSNIWLPFEYNQQIHMKINTMISIENPVKVDGACFYDKYIVETYDENAIRIIFSENLFFDIKLGKFRFRPKGILSEVKGDIGFIKTAIKGGKFCIGENMVVKIESGLNVDDCLQKLEKLELIINVFDTYGIKYKKKISDFTNNDWGLIDEIVSIYERKFEFEPECDFMWYMWEWEEKIFPIIIYKNEHGDIESCNAMMFNTEQTVVKDADKKEHHIPIFINFKKDIWEKLYDVEEENLREAIEKSDFNSFTEELFLQLFMELLSAYDKTIIEKYYNTAELISEKFLDISPINKKWIINQLQIVKRKRELSEVELNKLESIEKSEDKITKCAVNILLDNKGMAKKELSEMSDENRALFVTYPIYNLL